MHFLAVKKSRKRSGFVINSYFKDIAFTAVKGDGKFKSKGGRGPFINSVHTKEAPFLSKMVSPRLKGKGLDPEGGDSPHKALLSSLPGFQL